MCLTELEMNLFVLQPCFLYSNPQHTLMKQRQTNFLLQQFNLSDVTESAQGDEK